MNSESHLTQRHRFLSLFLVLFSMSYSMLCFAHTVKGRVASATDDTPLAGATIMLLTLPDSTFIAGSFADAEGNFSLSSSRIDASSSRKNAQSKMLIKCTFVGFQETIKTFTVKPKQKETLLPDIYMQEEQRKLGETVISATPPPMVIREDTIEYYASSFKMEPDATAEDLLKRLPGVEVAADGSITAQGENVTKVYVDGKEFFGNNIQATTKNLTADMFESVQVVDMKTEESRLTGIDNGEREKVINLKLKPKMRRGYFGNIATAWGDGSGIDDRFEAKGMLGYFHGNSQNALIANGNNTNNTGFEDQGNRTMQGSGMRGNRNSGQRGDGLNTSWSIGLNLNYDKGNRMQDQNTPFAIGGDFLYGGSNQTEESRTHRINYLSTGSTGTDSQQTGDNHSQNIQTNLRFEKSWGDIQSGEHRFQIRPEIAYNYTRTDESSSSANYHIDEGGDLYDQVITSYISQTQSSNSMRQHGINYGLSLTYSYAKQTDRGRRRSSITFSVDGRQNEGDHYTQSYTSYADILVDNLLLNADTIINQWQEESNHSSSYRLRLTHVEPISQKHFLEFSAAGNFTRNAQLQLYHFWDDATHQYSDTINGKSNLDYSSDAVTHQDNYTLGISYRRITERSNTSIGMDFLPSSQRYTDYYDRTRDYSRHYINYSPRAEYRYNWDRRTNLRLTLSGSTSQPSINQLQARKNQTSATHVTLGNKDLSPAYQTRFSARFRTFDQETYRTLEASLNASANFNSLVSKRWYSPDLRTDSTQTVNLSGLGNWNVQGEFRGSFPFADNRWYITTEASASYRESTGYANLKSTETQVNHAQTAGIGQRYGIAYRDEWLNVELKGNYQYQHTSATVVSSGSLGSTHQFGGSLNVSATLPYSWSLSSNISYTGRRGYAASLSRNQTIWNAQVSRSFLKQKNLSAFIKFFDILHQRSSISRSVSATSLSDRETTTLGQYFLIGCSMKFNQHGGRRGGGGPRGRGGERPGRDHEPRGMGGGPGPGGFPM